MVSEPPVMEVAAPATTRVVMMVLQQYICGVVCDLLQVVAQVVADPQEVEGSGAHGGVVLL
jgi:hypothetical protein